MNVSAFVNRYYIRPIVKGTGYNIVNTLTYAVILIAAVYLVLKTLKKLGIDLDRELWISLMPFVFLGGVTRALEDIGFFNSLGFFHYFFITPLIYLVIFASAFIPLLILHFLGQDKRHLGIFGFFLLGIFSFSTLVNVVRVPEFLLVIGVAIAGCFLTYFILTRMGLQRFRKISNWSPVFAHSLDSSATVIAVAIVGGYSEQHVLPSLLFNTFPVYFFIPIKLALASAAVYYIDKELSGRWRWMLKFTVLVLGLGPGTRNALTILMGT